MRVTLDEFKRNMGKYRKMESTYIDVTYRGKLLWVVTPAKLVEAEPCDLNTKNSDIGVKDTLNRAIEKAEPCDLRNLSKSEKLLELQKSVDNIMNKPANAVSEEKVESECYFTADVEKRVHWEEGEEHLVTMGQVEKMFGKRWKSQWNKMKVA